MQLFDPSFNLINSVLNNGTTELVISYPISQAGIYYAKVFGHNNMFSSNCYSLNNTLTKGICTPWGTDASLYIDAVKICNAKSVAGISEGRFRQIKFCKSMAHPISFNRN